ncbi:MAG: ABC transporter permease subunit [Firmicutes bacterium]|nr:ABC transporter permease subunit [Dethiobacter sp.]MBS3888340.1 ABC transporter permease subunit [Bacillota bacterium]MBS4054504.1 ABC transporter permease subunit [Thermaerobacter sp.]
MNLALFRHTLKRNWMLLVIFFGVLTMYMTVMLSMYDPADMAGLLAMMEAIPAGLRAAFGFEALATDLTGYLASWLYGLLMIGFPMVYSIILANGLVAKMVDNGSFAFLLSTPNTRVRIIVTQGVYALTSLLVLFALLFGVGVFSAETMFPGELDINAFLRLNITTMLVNMTVMMISFFFSCVFNETRLSLSLGAGIPISFLLMNMLGGSGPGLELLSSMSIFGFYDPRKIVAGASTWGVNSIYIALIVALFTAGTIIFNRKRLPL